MALSHHAPRKLRAFGFPAASPIRVNLATHVHSLARYSKRTMHTLERASFYNYTISRLLTLREEFFSAFPHGTVYYRTHDVFRVGGCCPPDSHTISKVRYSGYPQTVSLFTYGAVTLFGAPFQATSVRASTVESGSYNTTSPPSFEGGFSLPCAAFSRSY